MIAHVYAPSFREIADLANRLWRAAEQQPTRERRAAQFLDTSQMYLHAARLAPTRGFETLMLILAAMAHEQARAEGHGTAQ